VEFDTECITDLRTLRTTRAFYSVYSGIYSFFFLTTPRRVRRDDGFFARSYYYIVRKYIIYNIVLLIPIRISLEFDEHILNNANV
jgi:hypothetical protein